MEWFCFGFLCIAAYLLGSCPFAVWIGRAFLHKDIRLYGDHNPGAANVFRAGNIAWGFFAIFLEILKGMPCILLAIFMGLPEGQILSIGLLAIVGHAWSPLLKFKGGKATAVTFGVLLAIPAKEIVIVFFVLMFAGFFILDGDGWRVVLSVAGCLLFATVTDQSIWLIIFLALLLLIISIKNADALKALPQGKQGIYIGFGQK